MSEQKLLDCPYGGECCMRDDKRRCKALNDVQFKDGRCHFRKAVPWGPNMYDEGRRRYGR